MSDLEKAIHIAGVAHHNQYDKGDIPYICHPFYVMNKVEKRGHGMDAMIVAMLHDVVEDSHITTTDLVKEKFSNTIIEAIELLTHKQGISYEEYIEKIHFNKIARVVKIADLEHNMQIKRLKNRKNLKQKDMDRLEKYIKSWTYLTGL